MAATGRPPFYETVQDLEAKIASYWVHILGEFTEVESIDPETNQPYKERVWKRPPEYPTITGLALYLGFTSRQALINYEEKEDFVDAVKKAKLQVEANYEQFLFGKNAAGPIFALKNFGWTDKTEVDQKTQHSGGISISWEEPPIQDTTDKGSN